MDNSTPEPPKEDVLSGAEPSPPELPPQTPAQPEVTPQSQPQPSPAPTSPLMPGQVIGANGAAPSQPTSPQPVSQPPGTQPVAASFVSEPSPQKSKKKWLLPLIIAVVVIAIVLVVVFLLHSHSKNKTDNTSSSPATSQSSNTAPAPAPKKDETSSWKTYSDSLITLKYPSGWTIKQDPNTDKGNLNVIPPSATYGGYLGEDNFTDNAKSHNSKTYWQTAYNSDNSEKIIAENSDSINGYDTYSVEAKDSAGSTTYSIVGKGGLKIAFYYPTNDKNNDTYEKIISTIQLK